MQMINNIKYNISLFTELSLIKFSSFEGRVLSFLYYPSEGFWI